MKKRTLLACAVAATLSACVGPQIHYRQLSTLDKGISPEAVTVRFGQHPLSVHPSSSGGRSFEFHQFRIDNGLQTDIYLLAFEKNQLLYWGYISEFRRQPDADLNAALSKVLPKILQVK
jgi:hypothetical protein